MEKVEMTFDLFEFLPWTVWMNEDETLEMLKEINEIRIEEDKRYQEALEKVERAFDKYKKRVESKREEL